LSGFKGHRAKQGKVAGGTDYTNATLQLRALGIAASEPRPVSLEELRQYASPQHPALLGGDAHAVICDGGDAQGRLIIRDPQAGAARARGKIAGMAARGSE